MEYINRLLQRPASTSPTRRTSPTPKVQSKSAIDTSLDKGAESDVKVQFSRDFADGPSSPVNSIPERISVTSSGLSVDSVKHINSALYRDSPLSSPDRNFDKSYVNANVSGLDDLILGCADINLNDPDEEESKVSPKSEISQDLSFASAVDGSVLHRVERDFDSTFTGIDDDEEQEEEEEVCKSDVLHSESKNEQSLQNFATCQVLSSQQIPLNTEVKVSDENISSAERQEIVKENTLQSYKTCQALPSENLQSLENCYHKVVKKSVDGEVVRTTVDSCPSEKFETNLSTLKNEKLITDKSCENIKSECNVKSDDSIQSFETCQLIEKTRENLPTNVVNELKTSEILSEVDSREEALQSFKTCLAIQPEETLPTFKSCLPVSPEKDKKQKVEDSDNKHPSPDSSVKSSIPDVTLDQIDNDKYSEIAKPLKEQSDDDNLPAPTASEAIVNEDTVSSCLNSTFEVTDAEPTLYTTFSSISPEKTDEVLNSTFEFKETVSALNSTFSSKEPDAVLNETFDSKAETKATETTLGTACNDEVEPNSTETFVPEEDGLDLNTTFDAVDKQVNRAEPAVSRNNVDDFTQSPSIPKLPESVEATSPLEKVKYHSFDDPLSSPLQELLDSTISLSAAGLDDESGYEFACKSKSDLKPVENQRINISSSCVLNTCKKDELDVNTPAGVNTDVSNFEAFNGKTLNSDKVTKIKLGHNSPYFGEARGNLSAVPESSKENVVDLSDISPPKIEIDEEAIISPEKLKNTSELEEISNNFESIQDQDYEAFKPMRISTTLTLPENGGTFLLEEAAQAVARDIESSLVEDGEDQFVAATDEFFADPTFLDDLLTKSGTNNKPRDLRLESLYVKFDPLLGRQSMLPQGNPPQATEDEHNNKNEVSVPDLGTPKKNPALAAIDRLLFYSPVPASTAVDAEEAKVEKESPKPSAQEVVPVVDETMAKELELVRSTVLQLEEQIEQLQKEHKEQTEKQRNEFQLQLTKETKCKNEMTIVAGEYEKTISRLLADREKDRATFKQENMKLREELQATNNHLTNTEAAFNDVHSKYERLKGVVSAYKSNESILKESIQENEETIKALENRYDQLKSHAMAQLEKANLELSTIRKQNDAETMKLRALVRRAELKSKSLEETVEQKTKENKELTQIIDEMIARVD